MNRHTGRGGGCGGQRDTPTLLAITARPALGQGFWEEGVSLWRVCEPFLLKPRVASALEAVSLSSCFGVTISDGSPQGLAGDRSLTGMAHDFDGAASAIRSMATFLGEAWAQFVSRPFQDSAALSAEAPSTHTRDTDRPSQAFGASTSRQSGRPRCGSTSTCDSSPGCRMLAEAKAQTRLVPVRERLDACLKFIERAKKRLESAEHDVIKAQEARVARETELSEGLANLQRSRSEATSAVPVPPVGGVADAAEEIRRLRAHIALLESGSTDTSREVMRQKKAKTLNAPSADLANMECTQLVSPEEVPVPRDPSTLMSTLINEAESALKRARPPVP